MVSFSTDPQAQAGAMWLDLWPAAAVRPGLHQQGQRGHSAGLPGARQCCLPHEGSAWVRPGFSGVRISGSGL